MPKAVWMLSPVSERDGSSTTPLDLLDEIARNGGVPGVDGQSFDDIENLGRDQWLDELAEELRNETYQPRPVRRVHIPKGDGKQRPLGIPICRSYCTSLQRGWGLSGRGLAHPWALSRS